MKFIILLFNLILTFSLFAQGFEIGSWKEYLPYHRVINVANINNLYYAATPYSIYYYDAEDNSIERLNKINALSDLAISVMALNQQEQTLIVGYESGNIDLIKDNAVINISGILNSSIIGDKRIYNIHIKDELAYLACGFGIVVLDISKQEVKDTYIIGTGGSQIKVNDITTNSTTVYAATDNGVYSANLNNPFLSNPSVWNIETAIPLLDYNIITSYGNHILFSAKYQGYQTDTIYQFTAGVASKLNQLTQNDYYSFDKKDDHLLISSQKGVIELDQNLQQTEILWNYNNVGSIEPFQCIWDGKDYWVADRNQGMARVTNNYNHQLHKLDGPFTNEVFHLTAQGDQLWVSVGGAIGTPWNSTYNMKGVLHYNQEKWEMYNVITHEELSKVDSIFDYVHTTIDPKDENHVFASTFKGGVVEIKDGELVKIHTWHNSTLERSVIDPTKTCTAGSDFDSEGNFWVSNSYSTHPLAVYTKEGIWKSFATKTLAKERVNSDLLVDKTNGYVWMTAKGAGIIVLNNNKTPLDESDDEYKWITTTAGSGHLPSDIVNTMIEDKNGAIWIGTEQGPVVIYNPSNIFNGGDFDAQEILIEQDGVLEVLLGTETINEIIIDGANRKWFATEGGGLFLISEDGTENIATFTTENSPLFSNKVNTISLNQKTGELYVGTDAGIMGYKGEATEPVDKFEDVFAYPNPVRPNFNGKIAIRGLTKNAEVKITDAAGNLVLSTNALGGQAIWDGKTLEGVRVATGIYYVFVVSEDGTQKIATKVLFIN